MALKSESVRELYNAKALLGVEHKSRGIISTLPDPVRPTAFMD